MGDEDAEGFVSWRWLAAIAVTVIMALTGNWAIGLTNRVEAQSLRQGQIEREHAMMITTISVIQTSMTEIKGSIRLIEEDMRHVRGKLDR